MLVKPVRRWKVPYRPLRLVVTATTDDASASMLVDEFVGPLSDVPDQVLDAERTGSLGMIVHWVRPSQFAPLFGYRHRCSIPTIAPWIQPRVAALTGILPFPLVRKPLSRPSRIRAGILQ